MKFANLLSYAAIGGFSACAATPRATAVIQRMEVIAQSNNAIADDLKSWSGKIKEFVPVQMKMIVILSLISKAAKEVRHSGDLALTDFDEVLAASTQLAITTAETMNVFLSKETILKAALLGPLVGNHLVHQRKASIAFADAVVGISPVFGPEVGDMLGKTISETYQSAIDHFKKKNGGGAAEDEQSEQEETVMP